MESRSRIPISKGSLFATYKTNIRRTFCITLRCYLLLQIPSFHMSLFSLPSSRRKEQTRKRRQLTRNDDTVPRWNKKAIVQCFCRKTPVTLTGSSEPVSDAHVKAWTSDSTTVLISFRHKGHVREKPFRVTGIVGQLPSCAPHTGMRFTLVWQMEKDYQLRTVQRHAACLLETSIPIPDILKVVQNYISLEKVEQLYELVEEETLFNKRQRKAFSST